MDITAIILPAGQVLEASKQAGEEAKEENVEAAKPAGDDAKANKPESKPAE